MDELKRNFNWKYIAENFKGERKERRRPSLSPIERLYQQSQYIEILPKDSGDLRIVGHEVKQIGEECFVQITINRRPQKEEYNLVFHAWYEKHGKVLERDDSKVLVRDVMLGTYDDKKEVDVVFEIGFEPKY